MAIEKVLMCPFLDVIMPNSPIPMLSDVTEGSLHFSMVTLHHGIPLPSSLSAALLFCLFFVATGGVITYLISCLSLSHLAFFLDLLSMVCCVFLARIL